MRLPKPAPGLVVRYAFLWRREHSAGQEEGFKDRPCAIILSTLTGNGDPHVYVLPITHSPPLTPHTALEIPPRVKHHLSLDGERSWIVLDEVNDFIWPGFDLRPVPGSTPPRAEYGVLPARFFEQVRQPSWRSTASGGSRWYRARKALADPAAIIARLHELGVSARER